MSKLTQTHFELARAMRWHLRQILVTYGKPEDEIEVDADVKHYHRQDRYRVIDVCATDESILRELLGAVEPRFAEHADVRISSEIGRSARDPRERILSISIWPGRPATGC